jgi:uncharacterized membrane protein
MLLVMWALGWSMVALAALIYLPAPIVTAVGLVLIAGHNLFDSVRPSSFGALAPLWSALHVPGLLVATPRFTVFAAYPLIPWVGVTAVGFGLGQVYGWTPERRRSFLLRTGIGLIIAFVVLRSVNVYGDPFRWSAQRSAAFTVLSFLNTNKYPPSLLYLLMTLGPALLLLWSVDGGAPRLLRPAVVIGRVPMFYYLLHFPLIHLVAVAVCYARYGAVHWMFESARLDQYPMARPPGWGFSLPAVYAIWIAVVIVLFPACRRFAAVKQRRSDWWLTYL